MRRSNRASKARVWTGSLIPAALILMATTVSLASICVGADGHVNLELRLWSDCAGDTAATSLARDDGLPEASSCCGACLHLGGDDGEWLTARASAAKQPPAAPLSQVHRTAPAETHASNFVRGLSPRPREPLGLASIVIRC